MEIFTTSLCNHEPLTFAGDSRRLLGVPYLTTARPDAAGARFPSGDRTGVTLDYF